MGAALAAHRKGVLDGIVIASVDGYCGPALDSEALLDASRPAVGCRVIVDDADCQPGQSQSGSDGYRLVVAALVQLGIADKAEHPQLDIAFQVQRRDWERLSQTWRISLDDRIAELEALRDRLSGCIGCGCLSLDSCGLFNPGDQAAAAGAGAQYLFGEVPDPGAEHSS